MEAVHLCNILNFDFLKHERFQFVQFYDASVNGRMPTVPHLDYRVKCLKDRASENSNLYSL